MFNAFRHHGLYRSCINVRASARVFLCSTPFGITDYIGVIPRPASMLSRRQMCSTPFGITDYIGSMRTRGAHRGGRTSSAQRLSASRIISVSGGQPCRGRAPIQECSTPFGITDYIGRGDLDHDRLREPVLNAFRHHGLYRLFGDLASHREIEVLNAFRHHGLYRYRAGSHAEDAHLFKSAQRLSASRIISGAPGRHPVHAAGRVLNAFRHHGWGFRVSCG